MWLGQRRWQCKEGYSENGVDWPGAGGTPVTGGIKGTPEVSSHQLTAL